MPEQDNTPNSGEGGTPTPNPPAPANNAADDNNPPPAPPETWEAWLAALPDDQRTQVTDLHNAHTQGLRSALQSEREGRSELETRIRNAARDLKVENLEDARTLLEGMANDLEAANQRADFFAEAGQQGIVDAVAAWAVISTNRDAYTDRRGNVDFTAMKDKHPALFRQKTTPRGNAGNGAGQAGPDTRNMNNAIRAMAGRQT